MPPRLAKKSMSVKVISIVATDDVISYGTRYNSKSSGMWNPVAVRRA
jgi:hypothetical protein